MDSISVTSTIFKQAGAENTDTTLQLAYQRATHLGIKTCIVASSSGKTAVRATEILKDLTIIAVTHSYGFKSPNFQELDEENRKKILAANGHILTCQHALGGVNRAIRKKFGTYQVDEIIAYTLRLFCQGIKVIAEISMMAADAGYVQTGIPIIGIAGSGEGADTAAIIIPTNSQTFFDLNICEIICFPSPKHPVYTKSYI